MKSIKEKQLLVKWAKAMGEPVDVALLEEVERHERLEKSIIESIRNNLTSDLAAANRTALKIAIDQPAYPRPPSLDDLEVLLEETKDELVQAQALEANPIAEETLPVTPEPDLISRAVSHITKEVKLEERADSYQQPDAQPTSRSVSDIRKKLKFLEDWVSKISLAGPGGGTYWLYDMGDTNYNLVKAPNNDDVLTYNTANAKWEPAITPGALSKRYYGSFYDTTNQAVASVNTGYFLKINTVDSANGFTTDGANVIAQHSGIYNLQFSGQIHYNGGGGSGTILEIWLTKNGQSVSNTNTRINISSNNPHSVAAWNFIVPLDAGDKAALMWGTNNLNIQLDSNSTTIGPAIPSVILTIVSI